jgi:hypothetical protein
MMSNFTIVFEKGHKEETQRTIQGRFSHRVCDELVKLFSVESVKKSLEAGKQLWQIPYLKDSFDEDNDSEESDEEEEEETVKGI